MIQFEKSYTRDTTLIIQQSWFEVLTVTFPQATSIKPPSEIVGVDIINDGVIEVWENQEYIKHIKKGLTQLSHQNPQFVAQLLRAYEQKLPDFWKEKCTTKKELHDFIYKMQELMVGNVVLTYLAEEEAAKENIKIIAQRMRSKDTFFATSDQILRESMKILFPDYGAYAICIRKEELMARLPAITECKKRFHHFVVDSQGYFAIETSKEYAAKKSCRFKEEIIPKQELRGQAASLGKAVGKVKILQRIVEMDKVQQGDVVISPMTTPALVPALRLATAIITDEGGLLSHAAIVSRELGIPCIIGTKVATKMFKDGDVVEVDANTGVVRKIK